MKRITIVSLFSLFLCGCVTMPQTAPPQKFSTVLNKDYDTAWKMMTRFLVAQNYSIKFTEKASGIMTTNDVVSEHFDADSAIKKIAHRPSVFMGVWNMYKYSITAYVDKVNNLQTSVTITVSIEAFEHNVSKSWHPCVSKGVIEKDLIDGIQKYANEKGETR